MHDVKHPHWVCGILQALRLVVTWFEFCLGYSNAYLEQPLSHCRTLTYTLPTMTHIRMRIMKLGCSFFLLLCICHIGWAQAEIYKSVDSEGHVTYSSSPTKGSKKLDLEPLPASSPPERVERAERTRNNTSSYGFPKVDNGMQKSRDGTRRKILEDELSAEENMLAEARQNLKDGAENPETSVGKDGRAYRNTAKYDEKIKFLQEQVSLHEKNVGALKTELSNLK